MHLRLPAAMCIVFLLRALSVCGQSLNTTGFTQQQGLPSSFVYQVLQDDDGFMWFCTENGLSRYDGREMVHYKQDERNGHYGAFHLHKGDSGRLWFVTLDDKLFCYRNGRVEKPAFHHLISDLRICWIDQDRDAYWLGTRDGYLCSIRHGRLQKSKVNFLPISNFCKLNDDHLLFYSPNFIGLYNTGRQHTVQLPLLNDRKITAFPRFLKLRNNDVLICVSGGLYLVNHRNRSISRVMALPSGKVKGEIIGMKEDRSGGVWLGTHDGAFRFRSLRGPMLPDRHELPGESVHAIEEDHEGNFWFATPNGAYHLRHRGITNHTLKDLNNHQRFFFTQKNRLYAISSHGSIAEWIKGVLRPVCDPPGRFIPSFAHQVMDSSVLIHSSNGNYQFNNGRLTRASSPNYMSAAGRNRWFQSDSLGIGYSRPDGTDTLILPSTVDIAASYIRFFLRDRNDNLWMGLRSGPCIMNAGGIRLLSGHPVYSEPIADMKQQRGGRMWIATVTHGIYSPSLSPDTPPILFTRANGLSSNHCKRLFIDNLDRVWVATSEGADRLEIGPGGQLIRVDHVNSANGLPSDDVNDVFASGSDLLVAHAGGITRLPANGPSWKIPPPRIVITRISNSGDTLRTNDFQFTFSAITFCSGNRVKYRYKLLPVDRDWQTTTVSSIRFPSLAPGKYTFEVYGANASGIWSMKPASVSFTVHPRFWQAMWFRILVLAAAALMIYVAVTARIRAIRMEHLVQRRIAETELKALRSQMNPHFIYNSLNSIQDYILDHNPEDANVYLTKFASLMRMILSHSSKTSVPLSEELTFLNLYLELEQLRLSHSFRIHLSIAPEMDPSTIHIPPMLIQPLLENAVKYGLPGKQSGVLRVDVQLSGRFIVFCIEDNGPGRQAMRELQARNGKRHESVGLKNISERLRAMAVSHPEPINIEDLHDSDGKGCGTRVTIFVPIITP